MASKHRRSNCRGAVAVELALAAPVLILLLAGIVDYSGLMGTIANSLGATRAGGEYAKTYWLNPSVSAATGTQTQVCTFYSGTCPVTASTAQSCTCVDNFVVTCPAAGGTNPCGTGGAHPLTDSRVLMYVTVTATPTPGSYQPLMSYPSLVSPSPPTVRSVARVQ
jgi:Flp pilus assembly protein TadG